MVIKYAQTFPLKMLHDEDHPIRHVAKIQTKAQIATSQDCYVV